MLKGGFPPIYPNNNLTKNENIKRNFSSNNIIDIKSIFAKTKNSPLMNLVNLTESDDNKNKKNRNFKSKQMNNDDFIDFINDLTNVKKINRPRQKKSKVNNK